MALVKSRALTIAPAIMLFVFLVPIELNIIVTPAASLLAFSLRSPVLIEIYNAASIFTLY